MTLGLPNTKSMWFIIPSIVRIFLSSLIIIGLRGGASAATCGSSGIPFRLEVLPSGQLVLGCASPSCFGTENGGLNIMHESQFNVLADGEDGFVREGDLRRRRSRYRDAPPELADCRQTFTGNCAGSDTWVGGILKREDGRIELQCCSYSGLKFSTEMGKLFVHPGEVYSGGEVIRDGRQTGFDLISNIKEIYETDGSVGYEVTVVRMSCLPDPPEPTNYVDLDARNDIGRIVDKVNDGDEVRGTRTDQVVHQIAHQGHAYQGQEGRLREIDTEVPYYQGESAKNRRGEYIEVGVEPEEVVDEIVESAEEIVPVEPVEPIPVQPVQPVQPYYPVYYRPRCFSGETQVKTVRGTIPMNEVKVGDLVLTKQGNTTGYTAVLTFLHRLPKKQTVFTKILLSDGNILSLTPYHFIYRISCYNDDAVTHLVYAEDLNIGDCVYTLNQANEFDKSYVLSKSSITQVGAYAPLTDSGDLVANNVFVSCHDFIRTSSLTQTFISWMQQLERWFYNGKGEGVVELPFGTHFFLQFLEYVIPLS